MNELNSKIKFNEKLLLLEVDYSRKPTIDEWAQLEPMLKDKWANICISGRAETPVPITADNYYKQNKELHDNKNAGIFYVMKDNLIIGLVVLTNFYTRDESDPTIITYRLTEKERGKGYGNKVIELIKQLHKIRGNSHKLIGNVYSFNTPSIRALLYNKFVITGISIDHLKYKGKWNHMYKAEFIESMSVEKMKNILTPIFTQNIESI